MLRTTAAACHSEPLLRDAALSKSAEETRMFGVLAWRRPKDDVSCGPAVTRVLRLTSIAHVCTVLRDAEWLGS